MLASQETLVDIASAIDALGADVGPRAGISSPALSKSLVVLATHGTLFRALVTNTSVSDLYLFILDAASLPLDGALPAPGTVPIFVAAGASNGDEFPDGLSLSTGCVLALSTTNGSLTLVSSDVGLFSAINGPAAPAFDELVQLTGDVTAGPGTGALSASVVAVQGRAVASTAPTNGQVLVWNAGTSQWQPGAPASGLTQLTSDVLAGPGAGSQAATVVALQGRSIVSSAPYTGQTLAWNGSSWAATTQQSDIPVAAETAVYSVPRQTAAGAGKNTWTVGLGGDFADLATAIASASVVNGNTIYLLAQTFTVAATITVNKQLTIIGQGGATILQTAAAAGDPVTVITITAANVTLSNFVVKQRKTTNTSLETAVNINATGLSGIALDGMTVESMEFCVTVSGADAWQIRNSTLSYVGPTGNTNRLVFCQNSTGNVIIYNNIFNCSTEPVATKRTRCLAITGGTITGSWTVERNRIGSGDLAQFFIMDGGFGLAGSFALSFLGNTLTTESSGLVIIYGNSNPLNSFSSITMRDNYVFNAAGKGLLALDAGATGTAGACPVYASGNVITNPAITNVGWLPAQSPDVGLIGYNDAIF